MTAPAFEHAIVVRKRSGARVVFGVRSLRVEAERTAKQLRELGVTADVCRVRCGTVATGEDYRARGATRRA